MLLNDIEIAELCTQQEMIKPYCNKLVSKLENKAISFGQSSFGYDIRLAERPIRIFHNIPGIVTDPKNFNQRCLITVSETRTLGSDDVYTYYDELDQKYFILPQHSYALGVSIEKFNIPKDITAICLGKSTYARCGALVNITPLESEWKGYLTIEIANISPSPCRIYLNEGIAQLLFLKGNTPEISYNDRGGKYQNQPQTVVLPK